MPLKPCCKNTLHLIATLTTELEDCRVSTLEEAKKAIETVAARYQSGTVATDWDSGFETAKSEILSAIYHLQHPQPLPKNLAARVNPSAPAKHSHDTVSGGSANHQTPTDR